MQGKIRSNATGRQASLFDAAKSGLRGLGAWVPLPIILGTVAVASAMYWAALLDRQAQEMQTARQHSELRAKQLNAAVTQQIDAKLLSIDVALKHLRAVYLHNPQDLDSAVADLLATYPPGMLQYVTVFGSDGKLVYWSGPGSMQMVGQYFGDREHFRVHVSNREDALFVSPPLVGRVTGTTLVHLTRGIWDGPRFRGVVGIPVLPTYLSGHLVSLQVDPNDILAVVRPDGSTIARSHKLEEALMTKLPSDRPFLQGHAGDSGLFRSTSTFDKIPMLFSWQRLSQWPLITVAAINEDAEMAPLMSAMQLERRNSLITMALVMAFSLGIALLMVRIQKQNLGLARSEARHRALFEHSKIPMLLVDPADGAIAGVNDAAVAFYGYPRQQLTSMHIGDLNQLPAAEIAAEMALAQQEKRNSFHFPHRLASGEIRQVEVFSGPLEVGGQALLYSFVHDVTDRVLAQQRLAGLLAEQRAILNSELNGIVKLKGRRFLWMNKAFASMLGYSMEELIGQPTRLVYPDDASYKAFGQMAYPAMKHATVYRAQVQFVCKDGSLAWFDLSGELLPPDGRESIWSAADITERKLVEDQVHHLAFHDGLTKLPNRGLLVERMGRTMAASKRSGRYAAMMFLDLDNFKPLNDLHGHDMGDLLLIEVAQRLRECVREIDTVSRFGGDEFVVMLSDLHADRQTSIGQAAAIAEKVRAALAEPYRLQGGHSGFGDETVTHHCTASIGVALFSGQHETEEEILNRADAAMYAAKHAGRNQVSLDQGGTPA